MKHLQKEIRKVIEEKLNEQTVDDIIYKVSLYQDNIDDEMMEEEQEKNSYDLSKYRYIPVTIEDIQGDYADIPFITQGEFDVVVSFLIPAETKTVENTLIQANTENVFQTLDNVRLNYNAKDIQLGEVGHQFYDDSYVEINTEGTPYMEKLEIEFTYIEGDYTLIDAVNFKVYFLDGDLFVVDRQGVPLPMTNLKPNKKQLLKVTREGNDLVIELDDESSVIIDITNFDLGTSFKINQFDGLIYYIGLSNYISSDGFDFLLIEDFETLENNAPPEDVTIEKSTNYGVLKLGEIGNISLGFSGLNPTTNQFTYENTGTLFQVFTTVISFTMSKDIVTGNHFKYFLEGVEIFPINYTNSYGAERYSTQKVLNKTTTTNITDNAIGHDFVVYYQNKRVIKDLMKHGAKKDKEQNKVYSLVVHFGTFFEEYDVKVLQVGAPPVYNSSTTISFELGLA